MAVFCAKVKNLPENLLIYRKGQHTSNRTQVEI